MLNKKIIIFSIFIILLVGITAVSANDNMVKNISNSNEEISQPATNNESDYNLNSKLYYENELSSPSQNDLNITLDEDSKESANKNIYFDDLYANNEEIYSFNALNYVITNSSNNTVILDHDYSFNETYDETFKSGIGILKDNLVIEGNNHVIDAKNTARIFNITGKNVTLKNIEFRNALSDNGGALLIKGNDSKTINCTFINNKATIEAGAIFLAAPHGQILNSRIINSSSDQYTGAVLVNSVNASVIGCYFENNTANISAGALGWAAKDNGTIKDCIFINNSVYNEGGGAIFWNKGKNGILDNLTFKNNYANYNGSAIYWSFGENGKISKSIFENNVVTVCGGAIYLKGNSNVLYNCTFTNNSANYSGGAVYFRGEDGLISDCKFITGSSQGGAAIMWTDGNGQILNCDFENITVNSENGGVIEISNANIDIEYCTIKNSGNYSLFANGSYPTTGVINLEKNNFDGFIKIEDGGIISPVYLILSDENGYLSTPVELKAIIQDDNENQILINKKLTFIITNGTQIETALTDDCWSATYTFNQTGKYLISANISNFKNLTVKNATVHIVKITSVEIYNLSDIVYGDKLKFTVDVKESMVNTGQFYFIIGNNAYCTNVTNSTGIFEISDLEAGHYSGFILFDNENYTSFTENIEFNVEKRNVTIVAKNAAYIINYKGKYSITVANAPNEKITFTLNGKNIGSATTNGEGIATITLTANMLKIAKAGSKNFEIKLNSANYNCPTKTVKITIKKEAAKITAKKKTFKKAKKIKKYKVTLKNSKGKSISKVKITLKIKKKTYTAKTNAKGKATFKIKKFTKKGRFSGKIIFKGNNYYKTTAKKVKIKIKI